MNRKPLDPYEDTLATAAEVNPTMGRLIDESDRLVFVAYRDRHAARAAYPRAYLSIPDAPLKACKGCHEVANTRFGWCWKCIQGAEPGEKLPSVWSERMKLASPVRPMHDTIPSFEIPGEDLETACEALLTMAAIARHTSDETRRAALRKEALDMAEELASAMLEHLRNRVPHVR